MAAVTRISFPNGFKWCVATSAHQIEGGNVDSDWWAFEQQPGHIKNGDRSGLACDHWHRVSQDVQLLRELNVSEYRFSIEWAKIEPRQNVWNWEAVAHYRDELAELKAAGIRPMVTLQHFTFPEWVAKLGGWEYEDIPALFARYALFVATNVAPEVTDWITVNEPMVTLVDGYMAGVHPPGVKSDMKRLVAPMVGLLRAHAAAYHAMKAVLPPEARIGMAHHLRVFDPPRGVHPIDAFLAGKFDQAFNWALAEALETGTLRLDVPFAVDLKKRIDLLEGTQDFIGVNYYSRDIVRMQLKAPGFTLSTPKNAELNDMGWEIYPEGFYRVLKEVARRFPGKSIFITENGIADHDDSKRPRFIKQHLAQLARAIGEGVPVEGYCHWSLMDNFEWADGFGPRFGLYEVDYATLERKPRASALLYSAIARDNGFTMPALPVRQGH